MLTLERKRKQEWQREKERERETGKMKANIREKEKEGAVKKEEFEIGANPSKLSVGSSQCSSGDNPIKEI